MESLALFIGAGTTAALLTVGHWFPWPRKLHRLEAYVYGLGSYLIGAGLWLWMTDHVEIWFGLVGLAAVAGVATGAGWLVDAAMNGKRKAELDERLTRYVGSAHDED